MSDETTITIKLSAEAELDGIPAQQTLQHGAHATLEKILTRKLRQAMVEGPSSKDSLFYPRLHDAVFIDGSRGSGKTTFLRTELVYWEKNRPLKDENKGACFHVLPCLDPTLIETKEHILVVITAMISDAVEQSRASSADQEAVWSNLRELAEGMTVLDGIGKDKPYSDWDDPTHVLGEGLRQASKGRGFERCFNAFLGSALKALGANAFLLAFDDVDTDFSRGWPVLEAVRKYLTSPKLAVLLSGDGGLYGRLVRKNIYATFGKQIIDHDFSTDDGGAALKRATAELEEQYLMKVLPPQNRLQMRTLGSLLSEGQKIAVIGTLKDGDSASIDIDEWLSEAIGDATLASPLRQRTPFVERLLAEPTRTVVSWMRSYDTGDTAEEREGDLLSVFDATLRRHKTSAVALCDASFNTVLREHSRWVLSQPSGGELLKTDSPSDRDAAIVRHCQFVRLARDLRTRSDRAFHLLVLGALPIAMIDAVERRSQETLNLRDEALSFLWIEANPSAVTFGARLGALARFDEGVGGRALTALGTIGVLRDRVVAADAKVLLYPEMVAAKADGRKVEELVEGDLDPSPWLRTVAKVRPDRTPMRNFTWFSLNDLRERSGAFRDVLEVVTMDYRSVRGEVHAALSATNLFATVAELLTAGYRGKKIKLEGVGRSDVIEPLPSAKSSSKSGGQELEEPEESEDSRGDADIGVSWGAEARAMLDERIDAWCAFSNAIWQEAPEGAETLGRIAMATHDAFVKLDEGGTLHRKMIWPADDKKKKLTMQKGAGDLLHRQITLMLNAVLRVSQPDGGRVQDPVGSDEPLLIALRKALSGLDAPRPIFAIFASCPLLWQFLDPDDEADASEDSLRARCRKLLSRWEKFDPAWLEPCDVTIRTGTIKKKVGNPDDVIQHGFFHALNVVPTYRVGGK